MTIKKTLWVAAGLLLLTGTFAAGWIVGRTGIGAAVDPTALNESERAFTARMKNASLVGRFTVAGRESRAAEPDRYDLAGVDKVGDDLWRFHVRLRHSTVDVTLPVTVPVRWVNGTPMIDITNYAIPSLGTFSAHVLFDGDQYAGTWSNPKVGGLMYGRIEQSPAP